MVDDRILRAFKKHAEKQYETIAKEVGLTRNAVKNRILHLEERRIIAGYKMMVNFDHFGKQSFKVFIKYDTSALETEQVLLNYVKERSGILATLKLFGKWNLDLEVQCDTVRILQEIIIELRNRFDIIQDYEIVQIIEDFGIDFYPARLTQSWPLNETGTT